jgi:hypothetical protein
MVRFFLGGDRPAQLPGLDAFSVQVDARGSGPVREDVISDTEDVLNVLPFSRTGPLPQVLCLPRNSRCKRTHV